MLMHYKIIGYKRYVCIDGLNENVKNMASSDRLEYNYSNGVKVQCAEDKMIILQI